MTLLLNLKSPKNLDIARFFGDFYPLNCQTWVFLFVNYFVLLLMEHYANARQYNLMKRV